MVVDNPMGNGSCSTEVNEKINLMVTTTEKYLPFGLGRHFCPGRDLAAAELKLFLTYLAVYYDLKLTEMGRPGFVSMDISYSTNEWDVDDSKENPCIREKPCIHEESCIRNTRNLVVRSEY